MCALSLAATAGAAGWNTNAWPSAERFRASTNWATLTTNVWVKPVAEVVTNAAGVHTNLYLTMITAHQQNPAYGQVQTNVTLEVRDLRSLDGYLSLTERFLASDISGSHSPEDVRVHYGSQWYRFDRDNLVTLKSWANVDAGQPYEHFVDMDDDFGVYTEKSNVCAQVGAPLDWHVYTPYRQLDGGGVDRARVITNTWTISAAGTSVVSLAVVDSMGVGHNLSGTNGQVVSVVVTNTAVADGWTHGDYGWRCYTSVVSRLCRTYGQSSDWSAGDGSNQWVWTGWATTWTSAVAAAEASTPVVTTVNSVAPAKYTAGSKAVGYTATMVSRAARLGATDARLPGRNRQGRYWINWSAYGVFSEQGDGLATNTWIWCGTSDVTNAATVYSALLGSTNVPTDWCDAPTNYAGTATGYQWGGSKTVIDWCVPGGFEYR